VEANNVLRKDVGWLHRINGAFGIYDTYPMSIASSVKQSMTRNEYVTIFPEGKMTYRGQKLLPFNKGAFYLALENEVPIIPIAVVLYGNRFIRHSPWVPARVHIHILPPIPTAGLVKPGESLKKKSSELADQVRDLIQGKIDQEGGHVDLEIDRIKGFT
jgi:1-acyl-sn-glycerol-3-phosphate acyltransferase